MSLSRSYWGPQKLECPRLTLHLTQAAENLALTCAWLQQGCSWRIKKPNRWFDSVLCLAKMKKTPNTGTYKKIQ